MAAVPDFGALAGQQKNYNDQAVNQTNTANRPNQYNSLGSSTWNLGPNGQWTQTTDVADWTRPLFNATVGGQQNLAGQVGAGVDTSGLMGWGDPNLTGNLGAMPQVGQYSQPVIDAWQRLQQPELDRTATATRNRLAAQGLTQGSQISNNAERGINDAYGSARDRAILAGYTQGNTEYDQALRGRAQGYTENLGKADLMNRERQQQFGERTGAFDRAMSGLTGLTGVRNSLNPNDWAAKSPTSAVFQPLNAYGAAGDTFSGNISNENIEAARRGQNISGASSLLGAAGGIGGAASGLGSLFGGASNLWGGYYGTGANTYGANFWNGGQDDLSTFLQNNDYYGTGPSQP